MIVKTPLVRPNKLIEKVLVAEVGSGEEEVLGEELIEDQIEAVEPEVIDVADEDLEGHGEESDHEGADARVLPDPGEPTDAQKEDHRAKGHIPYRSWCKECVEGRSIGEPHRQRSGTRAVCVFSFDYLFLDKTGRVVRRENLGNREDVDVTILVAKESIGKNYSPMLSPRKARIWSNMHWICG